MVYDIITFGSNLVDAYVHTDVKEKNGEIRFPVGTKIEVKDMAFSVGGGGINTAVAFSKLGLRVGCLGKIGEGNNGDIILEKLKEHGVEFLGEQSKEHTGYSIILETDKKRRTILTFKGASNNIYYKDIKLEKLRTKFLHFTSMSGKSFESQKRLVDFAKKNKIKISFNPSSYQIKNNLDKIRKLIKNSYVLSLNREEAMMIVGKRDICKKLHKMGPEIVCITNGSDMGEVYDGVFHYRFFPNNVMVSECTGAGDTFASSFITGLIKLGDVEKSIRVAMANSESVIQKRGIGFGLLDWKQVSNRINKRNYKVMKDKI